MSNIATHQDSEFQLFTDIFPLKVENPTISCFRPKLELGENDGNRLAYHLSQLSQGTVCVWESPYLYMMSVLSKSVITDTQLNKGINIIQKKVDDFESSLFSFEAVKLGNLQAEIYAKLAARVLQFVKFEIPPNYLTDFIFVRREVEVTKDSAEIENRLEPAIKISITSEALCNSTVDTFYLRKLQPSRNKLIGLKVRELNACRQEGGMGEIVKIVGTIAEYKDFLISKATKESNKQIILKARNDEFVFAIKFGNKPKEFLYPASALRIVVNADNASVLGVDYEATYKAFKIPLDERVTLIKDYKAIANQALSLYGVTILKSLNSKDNKSLFWEPSIPPEDIKLLFGNNVVATKSNVSTGLKSGGVYRRHEKFKNVSCSIKIAALKLCDFRLQSFLVDLQKRLELYKFRSDLINTTHLNVKGLNHIQIRHQVEKYLNEVEKLKPDIVIIFLPGADVSFEAEDRNSLYYYIFQHLHDKGIASQMFYEHTIKNVKYPYILNETVPAILAKLGNVPYVLAEPIPNVDVIINLDVSRKIRKRGGTINACASIAYYDARGDLFRCYTCDDLIEGEIFPNRTLEKIFSDDLKDKNVLVIRDGYFVGGEAAFIVARSEVVGFKPILIECKKSGFARIFGNVVTRNGAKKLVQFCQPRKGCALINTRFRANLVTTKVSEKVGLARPIQLAIHSKGFQPQMSWTLEAILKLILIHYGSQKDVRTPAHSADRVAYLALNGIRPHALTGDNQYWH